MPDYPILINNPSNQSVSAPPHPTCPSTRTCSSSRRCAPGLVSCRHKEALALASVNSKLQQSHLLTDRKAVPAFRPAVSCHMDYSSYFPQNYQSLTAANLQAANTAFSPNGNAQQPQQPRQNGQLSQLPQNMFFLDDPFDVKMETNRPADIDHASFSSIPLPHV